MTLVVLGLDGFHEDLLEYTPFVREQYEANGGPLKSTVPPVTAPAWASFQTGVNQGKHGVFDFVEYSERLEMSLLDGRSLRAKPVYEWLTEAGYDCYIQNLPFALPPRINGDIMPSWLDSGDAEPAPADLADRYGTETPMYPELDGDTNQNIAEMQSCFDTNAAIFESILREEAHDFYFHLVSVTDWLQHEAYRPLVEDPDSTVATAAESLLGDVDEFVARVADLLPDGADLLLLSDHGFRLFDGSFFVNDWLAQEDYLKISNQGHRFTTKDERDTEVVETGSLGHWLRDRAFWPVLRPIKDAVEDLLSVDFAAERRIDLEKSVAYCRSKDEKAIRCNPDHEEYDAETPRRIRDELRGVPMVSAELASDLYTGPYVDEAGAVILRDGSHLVKRGPIGNVVVDGVVAHHSSEGIVVGIGSGFDGSPDGADLTDLAPTLLHRYGLGVPRGLDGRVLQEFLSDGTEITYQDSPTYEPTFLDRGEAQAGVEDRLENLGYL
jgi:predicted AlkP superfamily phosphohydrolase/phosphomutase